MLDWSGRLGVGTLRLDRRMDRTFALLGALLACLAVGAGAFGAHALRERLTPDLLDVFETAARYQMYHALALFAVAWVASRWPGSLINGAGWLFVAGTVLFSGSLYAYVFTGVRGFALITPLGGACLIGGWVCIAIAAARR